MKKTFSVFLSLIMLFFSVFQTNIAFAATRSVAPTISEVTVTNNYVKADTVYVTGLMGGDKIKIYNAATDGKIIGTATAGSNSTSVTVTMAQIGVDAGSLYITDTTKGISESIRSKIPYDAEEVSDTPILGNITITNNANKVDTIYVSGISPGDMLKLYRSATGGNALTSATAKSNSTDVTMSISQLGSSGGTVYISNTTKGMHESARVAVAFSAEGNSDVIIQGNVTIINNVAKSDTIYVTGLAAKEVINVYTQPTGGNLLGSTTVTSNKSDATVTISQLGTNGGYVYISEKTPGFVESPRIAVSYDAESISSTSDNIVVTNNAGVADTVVASGVSSGDVINVYRYSTGGTILGSSTVASGKTEATVSISQLGTSSGIVYVSVKSSGILESSRVSVPYSSEVTSGNLNSDNVIVSNNAGKADTVYVSSLTAGDVINVYDALAGGNLLGTATVGAGSTNAIISITQLGISSGSVYVSKTSIGKGISARAQFDYSAESLSGTLNTKNILITNNSGAADTVQVTGLSDNQVVNVYDAALGGSVIGTATVAQFGTSVTITIPQLGTIAGSVYVSLTDTNKRESTRLEVPYSAQAQSTNITSTNVIVTNNSGVADTVYISGLTAGDVIYVYDAASGGKLLAFVTVGVSSTDVSIPIAQLGTSAGSVYVSRISTSSTESGRVEATYLAESQSTTLDPSNIVVTNNSGKSDIVQVEGLSDNEIVNVYDAASGGNLLGTATVAQYGTDATITIPQLGDTSGNIYVSLTAINKLEGTRVPKLYSAEAISTSVVATNVVVTNNASVADTVKVNNLITGDIVNIYDAAIGGNLLGTGTVASSGSTVTISIDQLGATAGTIYVSATNVGKRASIRTLVTYLAEASSDILTTESIVTTNNIASADTVKVTGLSAGDVINVYSLGIDGDLLGTATVADSGTEVTISIAQLGTTTGSIYVSRTSLKKTESARVGAIYLAEPTSTAPSVGNIIVTNNAGIADTIQVTGISANDVVNAYDASTNGNLLGTAIVGEYGTDATVTINQIGSSAENVYISVTSTNKSESSRTGAVVNAEIPSTAPALANISIINNLGIASTIVVSGLSGNDVIKVYDASSGGNLIGTANVDSNDTEATIPVTQLASTAGNVYISVMSTGKLESARTLAAYTAKLVSSAPNASGVTVVNNAGIQDTIKVTGLQSDDVVKVYDSATNGNLLASSTVASGRLNANLTVSQLGVASGNIYISVKSTGKTESTRTAVGFAAEGQSDVLNSGDITIVNNSGSSDIITVTGVTTDDVVNVYSAATNGTTLGTATVASGDSQANISISQLGTGAGSVYVTVTRSGKTESSRTNATYTAESTAPIAGNITIVNNAVLEDTITVNGLKANDIVKVYDAASNGQLIGTATVTSNSTGATVTLSQLTSTSGSVYISVTSFGKSESSKTKADYLAEQSSNSIYVGNVSIANNVYDSGDGTADTITVSNQTSNYVIRVYDAASGGNLIGVATVSSGSTTATISISQLSIGAGSVYMTVTVPGKNESSRTEMDYVAEN